jgi:hypothetical protein
MHLLIDRVESILTWIAVLWKLQSKLIFKYWYKTVFDALNNMIVLIELSHQNVRYALTESHFTHPWLVEGFSVHNIVWGDGSWAFYILLDVHKDIIRAFTYLYAYTLFEYFTRADLCHLVIIHSFYDWKRFDEMLFRYFTDHLMQLTTVVVMETTLTTLFQHDCESIGPFLTRIECTCWIDYSSE